MEGKKAYIISQPESALVCIDLEKYKELKRIKFGEGLMLETATTTPDGKPSIWRALRTIQFMSSMARQTIILGFQMWDLSPWAVEIIGETAIATNE